MFPLTTFSDRREALVSSLDRGVVLLLGNKLAPMNVPANPYPFHQDAVFRYYAGLNEPGLALCLDAETGEAILFGHDPSLDDVVWEGPLEPLSEKAARVGISDYRETSELEAFIQKAVRGGRTIHYPPPYRSDQRLRLSTLLDNSSDDLEPSVELIEAVVSQRMVKTEEEIRSIESAVALAETMHRAAMAMARPGVNELEVAAEVERVVLAKGGHLSFPAIVSQKGEVLHGHATNTFLEEGSLLLVDAGAHEPENGYASDITRTTPIGGVFDGRQREAYEAVLQSQEAAIEACRPGTTFREVHNLAARVLVDRLKDIGLMKGDSEEAVAEGAHALFFPHGLGHPMGLDVHDLEGLGEDRVGYDEAVQRSDQFGTRFLRFGRVLEEGFVMTIEPGFYVIEPLIRQWRGENRHAAFLDYDAAEDWIGFGGIRIEDDVLITPDGARVLGPPIPKEPENVEEAVQVAV